MSKICKACHDAVMAVAREYCHTPTMDQVHTILWTCTCYPAGCVEDVLPQVRKVFEDSEHHLMSDVIEVAMARVDREIEQAMANYEGDATKK